MSLAFGAIGVFCTFAAMFRFLEWAFEDRDPRDIQMAWVLGFVAAVSFWIAQ